MTPSELLDYLGELGVHASAEGGSLRLEAPRGTVTEHLAKELHSRKAELLDLLRARQRTEVRLARRARQGGAAQFPLSFAQHGFFLLDQVDPGNGAYNIFSLRRIRRPLDPETLARAVARVVRRNEILRTTFHRDAEGAVQRVAEQARVPLRVVDLTGLPRELRDAELSRLTSRDRAPRFVLSEGPLLSVELVRLAPEDNVLRLAMHHIIGDAVSLELLFRQLAAAYGSPSEQERDTVQAVIQYGDYASWQQERLARGEYDSMLDYWRRTLTGCPALLPCMGAGAPRARSTTAHLDLTGEQRRRLGAFAQRQEISPFGVLLAAFKLLLSRYAGVSDVTVLVPVSKRDRPELGQVMGPFLSVVAMRTAFAHETVGGLLRKTRAAAAAAIENSDVPLEVVEGLLRRKRTPVRSLADLSRIAFNYLSSTDASGGPADVEVIESDRQEALFEMMLVALDSTEAVALRLELKTGLFPDDFGAVFLRHYLGVLEGIIECGAEACVDEIDFLSSAQLVSALNLEIETPFALALADERQIVIIGFSKPDADRSLPVVRTQCRLAANVSRETVEDALARLIESAACLRSRAVVSDARYLEPVYIVTASASAAHARQSARDALFSCDESLLPELEASTAKRVARMTAERAWGAVFAGGATCEPRLVLLFNEVHVAPSIASELTRILERFMAGEIREDVRPVECDYVLHQRTDRVELPSDVEGIPFPARAGGSDGECADAGVIRRALPDDDLRILREFCEERSVDVADALRFVVGVTLGAHLHLRSAFYTQFVERRSASGSGRAGICIFPAASALGSLGIAEAIVQLRHLSARQSACCARAGELTPNSLEVLVGFGACVPDASRVSWIHPESGNRIRIEMDAKDGGVELSLHNPARLPQGGRFLERCVHLIRQLPRAPQFSDLDLLLPGEAQTYTSFNGGRQVDHPAACAHESIFQQAERTPDRTAVKFNDSAATYGELAQSARRLARWLRLKYPDGHVAIGLAAFRSLELPASVLGILASGCTYVPLDPRGPEARIREIVAEAGVRLILTDEMNQQRWPDLDVPRTTVAEAIARLDAEPASPAVDPDATAYVMFTSGSSGTPKGVPISHASLFNFLRSMVREPGIAADDVLMATTTVIFDISLLELLLPLTVGAAIVVVADADLCDGAKLIESMHRHRVSIMQATPSLWQLVLAAGWPEGTAVRALCGGELMPEALRLRLTQRATECWNMYGPTETTIWSACIRLAPDDNGRVVGRPIDDTAIYILDGCGRLVPPGLHGEIAIAGAGLSRGYLGQPALTAARFMQTGRAGMASRVYRTGDLGTIDEAGRLIFLGRIDRQLKVRGHLVEPAEIEKALLSVAGVTRVVVLPREDSASEITLVAYVECSDGHVTEQGLRECMRQRLPGALIPQHVVLLPAFPLLPNSKVDISGLLGMSGRQLDGDVAAPRTDTEWELFAIWAELLGRRDFGIHSNFFEVGGHSILLVRSHALIIEQLDVAIEVVDLFNHPTIEQIAALVDSRRADHDPRRQADPIRVEPVGRKTEQETEVAVIGMGGRFPGADSIDAFWRNLVEGVESVTLLSPEELLADGADPQLVRRVDYVRAAALLQDAECFDAEFFRYSAREAELTDPQHRLLLECAHAALEDAGYVPGALAVPVGLFAGVGFSSYLISNILRNPALLASSSPFEILYANDKDYAITQLAYRLNLRGPCVSVGTACSTGLVAVHHACRSLREHECDLALAGAAKVLTPQRRGYVSTSGGITAPDGHCRPFDQSGAGTIFGSGGGVVVLKRLSDALRDRDSIYAVIKGSAVNNDGASKVGFTAPSRSGQAEVIRAALSIAGVSPETVGVVEAHGTATSLGDLIEFRALCDAFGDQSGNRNACALGSVKANVGHLDPAAGIAGFIKAALTVHHALIPPVVNFTKPNPRLGLAESPFFVNTRAIQWRSQAPRRAGVSAFGIGGTNAHAVLEQAPEHSATESAACTAELLVLSAASPGALGTYRSRLSAAIAGSADAIDDVAFTLQQGRAPLRYRWAGAVRSRDEAVERLNRSEPARGSIDANRRLVFMFPDEGSRYSGIARGLVDCAPTFRGELDRCLEVVQRITGTDLLPLLLEQSAEPRGVSPTQHALAQPALFAFEYALAQQLIAWKLRPDAMIGHGVGEYVAACLAGVFTLESCVQLVTERARLMESCASGVHSASLDCISARLEAAVASVSRQPPTMQFISGVSGNWITAPEAISPEYWSRQMRACVPFRQALQRVQRESVPTTLLEIGPDNAVTVFANGDLRDGNIALSCLPDRSASVARDTHFLEGIGRLWCEGHEIDWVAVNDGKERRRVHLPTYPFQRKRHWIDAPATREKLLLEDGAPVRMNSDAWLYEPSWKRRTLPALPAESRAENRAWLVFDSGDPVARELVELLRGAGETAIRVSMGSTFKRTADGFEIDPADAAVYVRLARELPPATSISVAYFWSVGRAATNEARHDLNRAIDRFLSYPVMLAQALKGQGRANARFALFTSGLHRVHGQESGDPLAALCLGPARTMPQEWGGFRCAAIDLPDDGSLTARPESLARLAWTEFLHGLPDTVVAYRAGGRWVECFERRTEGAAPAPLARAETFLLTGGLGGIGFELAKHLISSRDSRLIIVGRTASDGTQAAAQRVRERLAELVASGGQVEYIRADLAQERDLRVAIESAEQRLGRISGAFHLAGEADGKLLEFRGVDEMHAVVKGKAQGALTLSALLSERPDAFLVLFSSVTGFLGAAGQVAYTSANAFLSALAARNAAPTIAIAWDTWREVGMAVRTEIPKALREMRDRALANAISVSEGLQVLERILANPSPSIVVSTTDFERRVVSQRAARLPDSSAAAEMQRGMYARPALPTEFVAPETETERAIAALWQESFRIERVGVVDDFFALGGTSLHAVQLASRLQQLLSKEVSPDALLQHGTVRKLAAFLDAASQSSRDSDCLVELAQGRSEAPPLFLVHPVGGQVMVYRELVRALEDGRTVFGLKADADRIAPATVEHIAADYVTAIRAARPEGPFVLGGSSFGGMVAFEMAQQLTRAGFSVPCVILIDTPGADQIMAPLQSEAEVMEYLRPQFHAFSDESTLQQLVNTFRTNDGAMRRYQPEPYAGRVVYFKARVRRSGDPLQPDAPWRAVCSHLEVHDMPGDHLTMHAMPHVETLAAGLSAALGSTPCTSAK